MTIEQKKKLHKILLICLVSVLTVILLANAVLLYLFVPISPKNVDSIWHNNHYFYDYFYDEQCSRQEFNALFSSEETVLVFEIRLKHKLLDTVKMPQEKDYETWEEYSLAQTAYPELLKEDRNINYKKFIKTYQLDTLPIRCKLYYSEYYASIRFYVDDSVTVSTYRSYVKKLEAMQNDPMIYYVNLAYEPLVHYWTEDHLPIDTLFE